MSGNIKKGGQAVKQVPKAGIDFLILKAAEKRGLDPNTLKVWTVDENGVKKLYELDKPFQVGGEPI